VRRVTVPHILNLGLYGFEWSNTCPDCFTPMERDPDTHEIGSWLAPRRGLDMVEKRKIPAPAGNSACLSSP